MDVGPDNVPQRPDAAATLFRAARISILLVLGFVAVGALIAGPLSVDGLEIGITAKFAAMVAIAVAIGFVQFRHFGLALSVALAPMPATALALLISAQQALPSSPLLPVVFAYILGFGVGLSLADDYVVEIVEGLSVAPAVWAHWRSQLPPVAAILVIGTLAPGILAFAGSAAGQPSALLVAWVNVASILCALSAVPLAASLCSYGEDFIALSNRIREKWNRKLYFITAVVQPRWSWSATGILVVFLALAAMGSATLGQAGIAKQAQSAAAGAGLSVSIAAVIAAQGWRRALALAVVSASGLLLGCWGFARAGAVFDTRLFLGALDLLALVFAPLAVSAAGAARAARHGNDIAAASAQAIARNGPISLVIAIGALILFLPWYREMEYLCFGVALALIFAAVAALIFLPALTGVVEVLTPRRRRVEELYRLK